MNIRRFRCALYHTFSWKYIKPLLHKKKKWNSYFNDIRVSYLLTWRYHIVLKERFILFFILRTGVLISLKSQLCFM
ncbi:unnamed protein product [Blepharisma stoltei]|uniref:Uncharacterized protein n=1 Tax=Blepharisma stoltei TaxID=1481888 RepID=A0AAU9IA39_9CILI|nr:unnamed protein product [Blepharisma stoltei]